MDKSSSDIEIESEHHFMFLLISLLGLILVYPFFIGSAPMLSLLMSAVMLTAIFASKETPKYRIIATGLAVPFFILIWFYTIHENEILLLSGRVFGLMFFFYITYVLLDQVLKAQSISIYVVMGGISIYLILGIIWALIYGLLDHLIPGSFVVSGISSADAPLGWHRYLYFSFVTLTTLGYGDITPATPYGQSLIILEVITGVFYVGIFIARLVGMYIGEKSEIRR